MATPGLLRRSQLITEQQFALLDEIRGMLTKLQTTLELQSAAALPEDRRTLQDTIEHLDELFMLVIIGEFNSGKSTFINALLGDSIQAEGVTPTTDHITLLRYGDEPSSETVAPFVLSRTHPADVLRQIVMVDTPGTNAVIRRHEELTRNFIPRADLVLFTTSAERPFSESERAILELIREWGKKIVLLINKADILEGDEVDQVLDFVRTNAYELLGITPQIFPLSARKARKARQSDDPAEQTALWAASRFDELETYILYTLDEHERVRLKLLSPVGVAERLTATYLTAVEARLDVLREDTITIENIEGQLDLFRRDQQDGIASHLRELDAILERLRQRGDAFIDETFRLRTGVDLVRTGKIEAAFEQQVIADTSKELDQQIQKMVDWAVEKNLTLWQHMTSYINRRIARHSAHIAGDVSTDFDYNRSTLLASVEQGTRRIMQDYNRDQQSTRITADIQKTLARAGLVGVTGMTVGATAVALTTPLLVDVTGVLLMTAVVVGGLLVLPAKRREARGQLRQHIDDLRERLVTTVEQRFQSETDQSLDRIRDAISPYTRFVRAQHEQLVTLQGNLSDVEVELEHLRRSIEAAAARRT